MTAPVRVLCSIGRGRIVASAPASVESLSAATKDAVVSQLKQLGYAVGESVDGANGGWQVAGRKGILKEVGSLVFHLSIIVLIFGGFLGARYGYSVIRVVDEGQICRVPDRPFLLRCDWFKLIKNPDGSIREYQSKLSLLRPDSSVILEKTIEVNNPLSYQSIRFYLSSYGVRSGSVKDMSCSITGPGLPDSGYRGPVSYGKAFLVPGTDLTLMVSNFLPDFTIDLATREASTMSDLPNNPAVWAILYKGKDTLYRHWTFFDFPGQHLHNENYRVVATAFTPACYTGIQIRKNPGVPCIWAGIIGMTLGIFAVFFMAGRSIWVFVEPGARGTAQVSIGADSNRTPGDFRKEMEALEKVLKVNLQQRDLNNETICRHAL